MGKIRERRRREQKKRQLKTFAAGCGLTIVGLMLCFCLIRVLGSIEWTNLIANAEEEQSESQIIEENTQEEEIITQIVMIGDMLMHSPVIESGKQVDGSYNFNHLFSRVAERISAADLAIVNQETIMGGPEFGYTGYPNFNTPYELADAEVAAGFDVLLFATNHAYDKGEKGILNCINYMESTYPEAGCLGINSSQEAQDNNMYVVKKNGMKIAILNYTYGYNGNGIPENKKYLLNEMNEEKIRLDIRKAEEIADFTILCPHWGTEFRLDVDDRQKELAALFLEEGVDLVLGTHPHVIEPVEWLTHENGNKMLVYYSLGNFVSGTNSTGNGVTNRMLGGIADVSLARNKDTNEVEIVSYDAIPVVCHIGEGTEYTIYYLEEYTEELAAQNKIVLQDPAFSKELCESIVNQVWGE